MAQCGVCPVSSFNTCWHLTGHEVVEVDGFIFKRKRAQPKHDAVQAASEQSAAKKPRLPGPSPKPAATPVLHPTAATPAAHPSKPLSVALPEHISAATPAARTNPDPIAWASATPAAQTGVKPAAVATVTPAGATAATAALLQQLPTDAAEPDRLASLCELLCAAEIEDLGAAHTADDAAAMDAVRAVLTSFAVAVRAAATEGKFEVSAAGSSAVAPRLVCSFWYVCHFFSKILLC